MGDGVKLLGLNVPFLWYQSKVFIQADVIFRELKWTNSLKKHGSKFLVRFMDKKGLNVATSFLTHKGSK